MEQCVHEGFLDTRREGSLESTEAAREQSDAESHSLVLIQPVPGDDLKDNVRTA